MVFKNHARHPSGTHIFKPSHLEAPPGDGPHSISEEAELKMTLFGMIKQAAKKPHTACCDMIKQVA